MMKIIPTLPRASPIYIYIYIYMRVCVCGAFIKFPDFFVLVLENSLCYC